MTIGTLNMKEFFQKVKFIALVECVWGKTRNKGYSRRHIHGNYAPSINYKPSDLRKIQSMNEQLIDFI